MSRFNLRQFNLTLVTFKLLLLALLSISCAKKELPKPDEAVINAVSLEKRVCEANSSVPCELRVSTQADALDKALLLYRRIVGVSIPITSPVIQSMATEILNNNPQAAATIATNQPDFLSITVRYMGIKMSYRDEKSNHASNDFVAALVGAVRDDLSAQDLMGGNFTYRVDPARVQAAGAAAVRSDVYADILRTNNHYSDFDARGFRPDWLIRKEGMDIVTAANTVGPLPAKDASALLTSRGFTSAHAIAGTNRRMYEFAFKQFMCLEMVDFMDTTRPDVYVGRDVPRYDEKYQTRCKGCHGQMDGMRGAFANIDFFDNGTVGFLKHSSVLPAQALDMNTAENEFNFKVFRGPNNTTLYPGVSRKMNQNEDKFPVGRIVDSDSWVNLATGTANTKLFGWRGALQGNGVNSFARMIASSQRFSECMAQKAFIEVCKRTPNEQDRAMISWAGKQFEANGYKFKKLFQIISVQTECLGQ